MNEIDYVRNRIAAARDRAEQIGIDIALGFKCVDIDAAELELTTLERRLKRLRQDEQRLMSGQQATKPNGVLSPRGTSAFGQRYRSSIALTR
jgi:hypothetical protein